ncbi:MAG: putative nucleotide-diphospho-sugar transferase [Nitrosopumilus sp.]
MNYIIVGYYTKDTIYEEKAQTFVKSLNKFAIPHDIVGIDNRGDWYKNTVYKPTFLKKMLCKHFPTSIVYVDVDAEFMKYPELFDTLDCNIGAHEFDRSCYRKSDKGKEMLSGTIFLKNNDEVYDVVEKWEAECKANPRRWDQKSLEIVVNNDYYRLPGEYCKIWDRWSDVITDPVIVHYQASRIVRKNGGKLTL